MKKLGTFLALLLTLSLLLTSTGLAELEHKVELPFTTEDVTLSIYVGDTSSFDLENNVVIKYVEEMTGVKLDLVSSTGAETLTLLLNSGDYPDIILDWGLDASTIAYYGTEQGIFLPAEELIDKYSVNIKAYMEANKPYAVSSVAADGHIYGTPKIPEQVFSHSMASRKAWINQTWLEKLGLEMPNTTDELYDVLIAFRDQDPNGNGIKDEIPISGCINTWAGEPQYFLLNSFVYTDPSYYLYNDAGTLEFVATSEEFKEGIAYIKKLYNEGLIDPAAFTQDLSQLQQLGASDPTTMGLAFCGHLGMAIDTTNLDVSKQFTYMVNPEGPAGKRFATTANTNGYSNTVVWAITDNCEHPEIAMRMIDFFFDDYFSMIDYYGIEGKQWKWAEAGTTDLYGREAIFEKLNVFQQSDHETDLVTDTFCLSRTAYIWGSEVALTTDVYDPMQYEYRLADATKAYAPYFPEYPLVFRFSSEEATSFNELKSSLTSYVNQCVAQFIVGDMDLDSQWEEYVQQVNALNVAEYVEIAQAAYNRLSAE